MKQLLQNLSNGETTVEDVPVRQCGARDVLITSRSTLISAGTERMVVEFGRANLINKARQQPEKVGMVWDKVRTDGLMSTLDSVQSKLDQPIPLGYCNVGTIAEVGERVESLAIGDRVVSNGPHAEVVCVPQTLVAKIPETVTDEQATFAPLAAIGLQGIRLARAGIGECVVVSGLGLIGLIAAQLLRAQGCRVLGTDFDERRLALANKWGIETLALGDGTDPVAAGMAFSRYRGVDAVLITASTKSPDPVRQAAQMCRKRGRIVLVGTAGLELNRADFYEKELSFQVSCSYGPGRYDPSYEAGGQDYPYGFVRWTAQRNFEAALDAMSSGALQVDDLITHRFPLSQAKSAYDVLANDRSALGIMLSYDAVNRTQDRTIGLKTPRQAKVADPQSPTCGVLGAGNFASRTLIPALGKAGAQLHTIVSSGGVNAAFHGNKAGFAHASTDEDAVIGHPEVNTVVVATRHNTHGRLTANALRKNQNVFVEKPLAIDLAELAEVESAYQSSNGAILMVGFNRRFSPLTVKMKELLDQCQEPKCFVATINAGAIPADSWIQDRSVGGGRVVGEVCHFVDLLRFLADSPIASFQGMCLGENAGAEVADDKASIQLAFENGSHGTIHYFANGGKRFPKERIEVFAGGAVLQNQNFRRLKGYGWPGFRSQRWMRQDKGHRHGVQCFLQAIRDGLASPIPFSQLMEVSRVTIEIAEVLRSCRATP